MPKTAIQVRVSAEQRDKIKARADAAGLSLSDYVRTLALGESEVEAVEPSTSAAPSLAATPPVEPEPSPPAPGDHRPADDDDLEAKIERRAQQLHARMSKSAARAQARRELD